MTNAIRYSPTDSEIVIEIKEKATGYVSFSVQDKGKGIEPRYQSKIFERYFQIANGSGGTGLGLAISKEFIEAQGGKIWVESEVGLGSTFSFELALK